MIFIETERLCLRNFFASDATVMLDYRNSEICSKYQRGQVKDINGIKKLIEAHKNDDICTEAPFMLAVGLKGTDEMIGEIVVMPVEETFSFGYTFHYRYHRKGYAFEALSALEKLLHEGYPSWEFISFTDRENIPSIALLEKMGYKNFGYLPSKESQVFGKWTKPATEDEITEAISR